MKHNLTADQINSYQQNGYLVIEDFLSPDELAFWREAVDEAVAKRDKQKLPDRVWVGDMEDDEKYYETVFVQRLNLWQDNEKVRQLMVDERLGKMATELSGADGIRIWHDQALYKPPWGNPTAWHLDVPYWSFTSRDALSIWVALDDVKPENGCLYFMPGTHKETVFENPGITEDLASIFNFYPQFKDRETVAAPMKAGSCSFHNGLVVHAAGPNMTPNFRRAMTCAYMPQGSTFNGQRNILSKAQMDALNIGDELNDEAQNPLLYSRK